jgi:hypothetical protein
VGKTLEVSLEVLSQEPDRIGINLYYTQDGKTRSHSSNHPGNGAWTFLKHKVILTADMDPESFRLLIRVRPGASHPSTIRNVSATLWTDQVKGPKKQPVADPFDGMYGPIHTNLEALKDLSVELASHEENHDSDRFSMHDPLEIRFSFDLTRSVLDLNVTLKIFRKDGLHLTTISTLNGDLLREHREGKISCSCKIHDFDFTPGTYILVIAIHEGKSYLYRNVVKEFAVTGSGPFTWGVRDFRYSYRVNGEVVYENGS